jgi:hypothetical protein
MPIIKATPWPSERSLAGLRLPQRRSDTRKACNSANRRHRGTGFAGPLVLSRSRRRRERGKTRSGAGGAFSTQACLTTRRLKLRASEPLPPTTLAVIVILKSWSLSVALS